MNSTKLERALLRFDEENAQDPNLESVDGEEVAKEWIYGRRMSETLARFTPDAPELVQLAVRAQHLRRWEIPRSDYPAGRAGYLRWRTDLGKRHGELAAAIAKEVDYDDAAAERVASLVRKRGIQTDKEAQLVEDVACLVFLEHYFAAFAKKHDDEKLISIVQKTWAKMSDAAHGAALQLPLGPSELSIVEKALQP